MKESTLQDALKSIFQGIVLLNEAHPGRKFTIDGRLVGDIGEVIASRDYLIKIDEVSQPVYDGICERTKRRVQIKATFKDSLTFKKVPDLYLGIKLKRDGSYEEIFNGPGKVISDAYAHRKGIGDTQLSFPVKRLKELSENVSNTDKVQKRSAG